MSTTRARSKHQISQRQMLASRPMEAMAVDIMSIGTANFLVAVDFFSGYLLVDKLGSPTTDAVISVLVNNFQKSRRTM